MAGRGARSAPGHAAASAAGSPGLVRRIATWARSLLGLRDRSQRDPLGPEGEAAAWKHLKSLGYTKLGANLRVPMGEADLLCVDPDKRTIVLVEVKARRARADEPLYAPPEASVHAEKRRKLAAILRHLINANRWHDRPARIDVVGVEFGRGDAPVIRHWINAVALQTARTRR